MALNPSAKFLVDLRKLEFGDASAEDDDFLDDDYVCNTALEKVIFNRARIVIGEKGSGKSAIFRIVSNLKKYNKDRISSEHIEEFLDELDGKSVVTINEPHNLEAYRFLINQKKSDDPDKFKILWLIYIAIIVGKEVVEKSDYNPTYQADIDVLKKILHPFDICKGKPTTLTELVVNFIKNFKLTIKIPYKGFEAEISTKDSLPANVAEIDLSHLLRHLQKIIASWETSVLVLIDRLDDFYKYDQPKMERMIQGLFLAIEELRCFKAIVPIIFLRRDIYDKAGIKDKDKFRPIKADIFWEPDDTIRFLCKRVMYDKQIRDIIGREKYDSSLSDLILKVVFPESIRHLNGRADNESIPFKEWLLLHLSNSLGHISPRDIIAFLSKCIDNEMGTVQAGKKIYFPILLEGSIVSAYNELSKEKFEDVIAVTGLSDIPNYLNAKCMRSFTYKKLKDMLEVDDNDEEKFTKQLNVLVSVGFIRMNTMQAFGKHYYVTYEVPPLYTANWKQPKGKVKAA